ncbi:MAG: O-antigen ligase family protein [Acidobacteriota bacterium]
MTRALTLTRAVVAGSVVGAAIAHALLLGADGKAAWPTLGALALGLAVRTARPRSSTPLVLALAIGPVWMVGASAVTGRVDLHSLGPWLALLAGWLAWPRPSAWSLTGAWQIGVVMWTLVLAMTWPIAAWRELDFTLDTVGLPIVNGSMAGSPLYAAAFVALTALAQIVSLLLFDWAWDAGPDRRRAWLAWAPGVAAACVLAVWQQAIDPAAFSSQPWIGLGRAAGPLYDANAMGALAALVGAALAAPALSPARMRPALWCAGWAALALSGVVASGSRTALAALVVSAAVTGVVALRGRQRLAFALTLVLVTVAIASYGAGREETPLGTAAGRLAGTVRRVTAGDVSGLVDIAWRRDGYGPASVAVIADHPWVGVGPGTFGTVIADYAREALGSPLPPDNAQNWWRQQLADLGVLGAGGALLCSILAALAVVRSWRGSREAAVAAAPLLVLGLMAVVSPATQHPVLQVVAALVVASAVTPRLGVGSPPASPPAPAPFLVPLAWTLAIACSVGLAVSGARDFRPAARAARFHFSYVYGISEPVTTSFGGGGRWAARRAVAVIEPGAGTHLLVRVVMPQENLATNPVTVTVSDRTGEVCRFEARDQRALDCMLSVPGPDWPFVQIGISEAWRRENGVEQAGLISARFEP